MGADLQHDGGRDESLLVRSLNTARRQRARCWELRACDDLARLWKGQGRMKEATQLLQVIYDQFTEGFDTIDLRDFKILMERIEAGTEDLSNVLN